MLEATNETKMKLRKVKTLPGKVKAVVYGGVLPAGGPAVAIQFSRDIAVYGLWEALLYVQNYERDGFYAPGTAQAAVDTYKKTKEVAS